MDLLNRKEKDKLRLSYENGKVVLRIPTFRDGGILKTYFREWEASWHGILNDKATFVEPAEEFYDDAKKNLWRRVVSSELLTGGTFFCEGCPYFDVFFKIGFQAFYYKPGFRGLKGDKEVNWFNGAPIEIMLQNFEVRTCDGAFSMDFKGDDVLIVKNEQGDELTKKDVFLLVKKNTDLFNFQKYDNLILFLLDR